MGRAISNKNVLQAKFEVADFEGRWLRSLGRPELRGTWLVYGGSGCGKTTFVLEMCKYLTKFGRVAYNSLEQGLSLSLQKAWERVGMSEAGTNIILLDKESAKDMTDRLNKRKSPDIIVIDSVQYWRRYTIEDHLKLRNTYPDKLFIYISQERKGEPKGSTAQNIRYDADIKIRVEGYKAFVTTRYEVPEKQEGGADFVIWEQGANEYWANITTETNR